MVLLIHFYISDSRGGVRMKSYRKRMIGIAIVWAALTLGCVFLPAKESSESERRKLAQFPTLSVDTILDGSFMAKFESYALDQFPFRDSLRKLKAGTARYLFHQKDNNGYYMVGDYVAKLDFPLKEKSVSNALKKMQYLYDTYLDSDKQNIYASVVPDKGYFLAEKNGYPSMDYEVLFELVRNGMPYAKYIDITKELSIEDYYKTDTHWKQENLQDVADILKSGMGIGNKKSSYELVQASDSFDGVYAGQSAYAVKPDRLSYLTNDVLKSCIVKNIENESDRGIYNLEKVNGKDPYDLFLSGATPLITVENPNATTDKELIVFRDSFGSSIAPLLVEDYAKVTLVDIRYMKSSMVGDYVKFDKQDVLFLYSTLLLNDSYTLG